MVGPYRILEKVGNLYKVDLPALIKVYLVILLDRLRKVANNPLPKQVNKPLLAIEVNEENKQKVEEVLAVQ